MLRTRAALADAIRPFAPGGKLLPAHLPPFNALADALALPPEVEGATRLDVRTLQEKIGVLPDGVFGQKSKQALFAKLTNTAAPAITAADLDRAAAELSVPVGIIRAVRKVEAPRGAFDDEGRPSILYERHVANRNTDPPGRYAASHPSVFGGAYGPGGYGSFSSQYDKLALACAVDPEAAFRACSWGAFQVLGENAVALGYESAFDMALALTVSEAAHLDSFLRFVKVGKLDDELRACRPGDPVSCVPFVKAYNGPQWQKFDYANKLASAAL